MNDNSDGSEPHGWNRKLCREFVDSGDRNYSRWFAGREDEMMGIESVFAETRRQPQTVFRVVQGAPGAGKTSLLTHMIENAPDDRLYVRVGHQDMVSGQTLDQRVEHALRERDPAWAMAARLVLKAAGRTARTGESVDETENELRRRLDRDLELALVFDEAQTIDATAHRTLIDMHARGFGRPCALVLVGLSHTTDVIEQIPGLSRPAENADINLSGLPDEDLKASTQLMFDRLELDASEATRERYAEAVAEMSQGWPQHLLGAQQAVAEQLLENEGDLAGVDLAGALRNSTQRRIRYYGQRLSSEPLLEDVVFTARIVTALRGQNEQITKGHIYNVCAETLARDDVPPQVRRIQGDLSNEDMGVDLGNKLIVKGALAKTDTEHFAVAIPSMADWLDARLKYAELGTPNPEYNLPPKPRRAASVPLPK